MSIFGAGEISDLLKDVIDRVIPDPAAKAAALQKAEEMAQAGEFKQIDADLERGRMQTDTNKVEAANGSMFVAGWRPFVGWVCGSGFAMIFIIGPLLEWGANLLGHSIKFPILDSGTLTTLLLGMLGIGGMRTYEKVQGVASTAIKKEA